MLRAPLRVRWPNAYIAIVLLTVLGVLGCGKRERSLNGIGAGGLPTGNTPDACASHQTGCPCTTEAATTACGSVKQKVGDSVICSEGVRTCSGGQWGDCVGTHEVKKPMSFRAPMQGGYTAQALGAGTGCDDLCDPGCQTFDDDANGLGVDVDLTATPDGISLPAGSGGGVCNNISLVPPTSTVTVTAISSGGTITATPNNGKVDFDATCQGGAQVEPSWTIDSYDRAVISAHGVVTVYSGRGGPIQVTGTTSGGSGTATLNVQVLIGDALVAAGTTNEVGKTLYPYNNTVFPLGLKAPLVQWTEGGITPTQTEVILCYPQNTCAGTGTPIFQYVKKYPVSGMAAVTEPRDGQLDNTVPAWQIPQEIWSAFDLTAAGDVGQIIIRRQAGATKYKQLTINVNFATDALRGTVYYTQYLRTLHTTASGQTFTYSGSTYTPGQTCEVGNSTHPSSTAGSQTRAIDLSTSAANNIDPFANGGYTAGCPVCHSVSADGSTAVSGGQNWQTSGVSGGVKSLGIDKIGVDAAGAPEFTGVFSAPNYSNTTNSESSGEDSRGFSYAAISPDGGLVLQAPMFWGSTQSTPSANNTQNANLTGVTGGRKLYFFADTKVPNPGFGVQFATTGALPAYTASGSGTTYTLTGTGTLTVDGQSMSSTSYSVLVKDETGGNAKNNGVYTVSASSPWKLKLRSDAATTTSFAGETEVRVTDGNANRGNVYYVSSPTSGTITPGSTALTFNQRSYPPMTLGGTTHNADYATTSVLAPATVTQSGNVLSAGAPGYLIQDGHTLQLGETLLVKDQANPAQNGIYKLTTAGGAGSGTPTTASYATTTALPANTNNAGVLTGNVNGPLSSIDGIAPAVGDTVLVKNEGNQANNGIYTVTTQGVTGSGTPLGAALCATTTALPGFTNSAGVLTETGFGALGTIDGCTFAVGNRLLVKNETNQANNGVYTVTALGAGGTVSHPAARLGTTVALPANTNTAGVLTGTSWGPLGNIDGTALAVGDRVLVMNETAQANNGIYTVTTTGTGTSVLRASVLVGTTTALPANTNTAGVLTATNYGGVGTIDGVTVNVGDRVLVMNEATQANNGIYTVTNAGTGTSNAHAASRVGTTAALPANSATAGVLTATGWGALPSIDGVTLAAGDRLLVMNETAQANNGIYTVTNLGTGNGTVHTAARAGTTAGLPANTSVGGVLTATGFGGLVVDGVAVTTGDRVLVKNEVTQANNGIYVVTSPGGGTGNAHTAARAATTGALPANANASGVLTATNWGALPNIDGLTLATGDRLLVKDEAAQANNGLYSVVSTGTGTGALHTAVRATTTSALPANTANGLGVLTETGWGSLGSIDGVAVVAGDRVLVKNEITQANNGIYVVTTTGTGTTSSHGAVDAATTGTLPAHATSGGVLTASAFGPLPAIDGITLAPNDRVLVKNEATQSANGIYVVTNAGTPAGTSHTAAKLATAAALPANTLSGGVLGAFGTLPQIDGQTAIVGDRVLVKDEASPASNGIYTVTALGTGSTATPVGGNVRVATTATLAGTRATSVITANANGALAQIDGVTLVVGDRILLKNQGGGASSADNGIYTVTSLGSSGSKWSLTRAGDANTSAEIVLGMQVGVTSGTSNGGKTFYLSVPASGGITLNTTALGFAVSSKWSLTRAADANTTGSLNPGDQVAITAGATNNGVTFYLSSPATGPIAIDTTPIAFSQSAKWVLTRASDADVTGELTPGDQVPVTGGSVNAGLAYYISSPASGTITINSTAIAFSQSVKWSLTRATDADLTGELTPGDQVPVTSGTVNVGTTYYLSTPATGVVTINVTGMGFSQSSKWVLARVGDADVTGELNPGDLAPVTSGLVNAGVTYYVAIPASGAITLNSTPIGFAASSKWVLTRASDAAAVGQLSPGDQVPVTSGTVNAATTYYVSSPASGVITPNVTAIGFSQSSKWVLTRASDADQTGEVLAGDQAPVTSGTANGGKTFYVSTPASGTPTINSSSLGFSLSSKWVLTRAADASTTGQLNGGDQVPVTSGTANGGKTFYVSAPASGGITFNTTAIAFSVSSKWSLTRATDADQTGELNPGDLVSVTNGTANANKTFYVSTPASGTITLNSTALAFSQAAKWVLTRATDADQTAEVFPGLQVPVTSGTANGGKTYYISTPASGTITLNTTNIAFSLETAWVLTRKSPYDAAGGGLVPGLQVTVSGGTANGGKTYYISTPMSGTIAVNTTAIAFAIGTTWQLTRTTDADTTGEITPGMEVSVANGDANAGRVFFVSSPTSGTITINTTAISFSYGLPSMMAPVISPNGKKIAYVNGDADTDGGFSETGWRRGLTMLSFDQASLALSSKKRLLNNWNATTPGMPVKWPFFEGDSRSLLYVETDPNEYCSADANNGTCSSVTNDAYATAVCSGTASASVNTNLERACYQAAYGSMSPTTRGFWPGRIYSIDTSASTPASTRTELSHLDDAEDTTDADKAYQPTVLPFTAGGKRWVIFTSPRAYGNQFNQKSASGTPTDFSCGASMLWVSALDDRTAAAGDDRSHPAFFMPGQLVLKITQSPHYVNERGYLVPSPCKSSGTSCSVDEECCGSSDTPASAACRAPVGWDPSTGAPQKKCEALSGTCQNAGESCATGADCCNGASCIAFVCAGGGHYTEATFAREYVATCPAGQLPVWTVYSYHLTTGGDSKLIFSAQTSDDLSMLDAAKVVSLGSSSGDAVNPAAAEAIDVGSKLVAAKVSKNLVNLRILVKLEPSTDGLIAPVLHDWEMRYTCQDQL